jgi:hypothetical protein
LAVTLKLFESKANIPFPSVPAHISFFDTLQKLRTGELVGKIFTGFNNDKLLVFITNNPSENVPNQSIELAES